MLYFDAALRRERHQRVARLNDVRMAFGANNDEATSYIKSLTDN